MPLTRSVVNESISTAKQVLDHFQVKLPGFGYWTIGEWMHAGHEYDEVRDCMLGWDVTDFGSNDFYNTGRVLFTLRNGKHKSRGYPKEYAEKILIDPENQRAPAHFHISKREDIICRGGGNILVQLTKANEQGQPSKEKFTVQKDGRTIPADPGGIIRLTPGQSICIPPKTIHQFWGEEGTGWALNGQRYTVSAEISSVCDDWNDNVFFEHNSTRFPNIDEDEPRQFFLCHEYPGALEKQDEKEQKVF